MFLRTFVHVPARLHLPKDDNQSQNALLNQNVHNGHIKTRNNSHIHAQIYFYARMNPKSGLFIFRKPANHHINSQITFINRLTDLESSHFKRLSKSVRTFEGTYCESCFQIASLESKRFPSYIPLFPVRKRRISGNKRHFTCTIRIKLHGKVFYLIIYGFRNNPLPVKQALSRYTT